MEPLLVQSFLSLKNTFFFKKITPSLIFCLAELWGRKFMCYQVKPQTSFGRKQQEQHVCSTNSTIYMLYIGKRNQTENLDLHFPKSSNLELVMLCHVTSLCTKFPCRRVWGVGSNPVLWKIQYSTFTSHAFPYSH